MVTGPAKNGHSCNQVWEAKGSGTCHLARLQASSHPQPPGCWQMLLATDTGDLESSGCGSGMRLRRGHHVDVQASTCAHFTRAALGCMVQRGVKRIVRKGERILQASGDCRYREEVTDKLLLKKIIPECSRPV